MIIPYLFDDRKANRKPLFGFTLSSHQSTREHNVSYEFKEGTDECRQTLMKNTAPILCRMAVGTGGGQGGGGQLPQYFANQKNLRV